MTGWSDVPFNQHNLEIFFGKRRSHGGRCDNPTIKDFVAIPPQYAFKEHWPRTHAVRGNCEQADLIDSAPLPKRKRHSAKRKL